MRLLTGSGLAGSVLPGGALLAAFEEGEAVGIEEAAAVGGQLEPVVLDAAVDGPEGGEQPAPGIVPPLQDFLAVLVGGLPQLGLERGDGVVARRRARRPAAAVPAPRHRTGTPAAS